MIFQQLVNEDSGCLSYLLGCGEAGQALIVDPGRDRVGEYVGLARKKGLRITRIVETHTHADHVSGHRDLAAATGAAILVHRAAGAAFEHEPVEDGTELVVGSVHVRVLHTPGHTPDSICLLVTDRSRGDVPWFVLTGDTLFVGSVGRPDFGGVTAAEEIWDSVTRVLLALDDSVEVYPGHGAGSLCGRAMSSKTTTTIGFERRFNPFLQARSRGEFVDRLMDGLPPKPASFEKIVAKNRGLVPIVATKPRPYGAREAWDAAREGAVVLDVRDPAAFGEGHVPGAINVWIESGQFADRVGWTTPAGAPLIVVTPSPSDLDRATAALTRGGVDEIAGFLQTGMVDWRTEQLPVETVPQITVHELEQWLAEGRDVLVVDVRETVEWLDGHIASAQHLPMSEAVRRAADVSADRPKAVVCAGGLRSSTVISALQRAGVRGCHNVTGGMTAWTKAGYPTVRGR